MRRAASARRLGSPCLTISSSPGISEVATVMKLTQTQCVGGFFGNLGGLREGRVRLETATKRPQKSRLQASRALPDRGKTAISAATYRLIRSRIESGPVPDPLFFISWTSPQKAMLGSGSPAGSPQGPASTQCTLDSPKTAKLDRL